MLSELQIIIPLRNPTGVLDRTIQSLIDQADKDFSVLVSDNHSGSGLDCISRAMATLQSHGVPARKIQPPAELERVEHWNWMHFQSDAAWVKPLFAGDWLEREYVARVRDAIAANPQCRFVHAGYAFHRGDDPPAEVRSQCFGRFVPPDEMQDIVLRYGHQFGPPNAVAYHREAFLAAGGYRTMLPICADSLLYCHFAARYGAFGVPEILSHFNLHGARFSTALAARVNAIYREKITYHAMLAYHAWTEKKPFPVIGFLRLIARECREYLRERKAT
jgi:hypothetical protein